MGQADKYVMTVEMCLLERAGQASVGEASLVLIGVYRVAGYEPEAQHAEGKRGQPLQLDCQITTFVLPCATRCIPLSTVCVLFYSTVLPAH